MLKFKPTYLLACVLLALFSCSKEEIPGYDLVGDDTTIRFRPELLNSRARELTKDNFTEFYVSCFNPNDPALVNSNGNLSCYFSNETFALDTINNVFINFINPDYSWPLSAKELTFFAYSPSTSKMKASSGNSSDLFEFVNASTLVNGNCNLDYKLTKFQVPENISKQFDFVTAGATAQKTKSAVSLFFKHQLSQVEVRVYGENKDFNIDIAGICLGNPETSGTFAFLVPNSDNSNSSGYWIKPQEKSRGPVSYIYQPGDMVKTLNIHYPKAAKDAVSIMGNGGVAMVIPTENSRWDPATDPDIKNPSYTTDKMYFSILMRLYDDDDKIIYPYPDNSLGMKVVYLAVDFKGAVVSQPLYRDPAGEKYYTDSQRKNQYTVPQGATVKNFGWAAVPVDANWISGHRYVYNLDYTEGVGLHQPDDPEPGEPIVGHVEIKWNVIVEDWEDPDSDFNPDPELDFGSNR